MVGLVVFEFVDWAGVFLVFDAFADACLDGSWL